MKRGCGFVALHYTIFVPNEKGGRQFLDWIGGYFDYQSGPGERGWFSKIATHKTITRPGTPDHPDLPRPRRHSIWKKNITTTCDSRPTTSG